MTRKGFLRHDEGSGNEVLTDFTVRAAAFRQTTVKRHNPGLYC